MEWYETAFDRFYPILYRHRNIEEATRVIEAFDDLFAGYTPILDLASGNGRYVEALSRKGHAVFGLDLSPYLLSAAVRQWGHGGRLVQGDMRHLPFRDGSIGAVINMFTSFGYFSADTDNLLVFKEVFRVLKRAGVFLFDFINAEKMSAELLEDSWRESGGYHIHERKKLESHGKYLVKTANIRKREGGAKQRVEERLRLYTHDELLLMFRSVGLRPRETLGDYSRNPFVPGVSERVIVVLDKP